MKRLCIIFCLAALLAGCNSDNTAALRENFQNLESCGICKDETMLLAIDMTKYQYMYSPSKGICRFTDESGEQSLTLSLSGEPSENGFVQGSVSGTLGQSGLKFTDLHIIKKTSALVWLWSDPDKCGIILPAWGTVNR